MKPTMAQAEQAAELLDVDIFDLMWALNDKAARLFERELVKVGDFESPNFGPARRFLRASQACDEAWRELASARAEAVA
jgi:hypothetical protein